MEKTIGIDLGTTNSCVAVWEMGRTTVIENEEGRKTTPSVVTFTPSGRKIGEVAKRQAAMYPDTTISSVKRLMGESYNAVKKRLEQFSYHVEADENGEAAISIDGQHILPQKIAAYILLSLKSDAERYLGQKVNRAVITVPAYFNEKQRQATIDAGRIAGLKVERIINEPTAAAMAYSMNDQKTGNIIVFDLGGGTFDISVLHSTDSGFEVIATKGDVHCGGDDIDKELADMLIEEHIHNNGGDLSLDTVQRLRVREAAEQAKIALSSTDSYEVNVSYLTPNTSYPHLRHYLLVSELEELAETRINHCIDLCREVLTDARLTIADIDHVLLVGGATKMPMIRRKVKAFFGKEPVHSQESDEIVAVGAAIQGAMLNGSIDDKIMLDVTPLSLGILARNNEYQEIIAPNTTLPTDCTVRFQTAHKDQPVATIVVCQAKNSLDKKVKVIKHFDMFVASSSGTETPKVDVNFDLNEEGILTVKATDVATGMTERVKIGNVRTITNEELLTMQREVRADFEADKAEKWNRTFPDLSAAIDKARQLTAQDGVSMPSLTDMLNRFDSLSFSDAPVQKHACAKNILATLNEEQLIQ